MPFLADYLIYNSANEVPENYTKWCGIFLLNATAQRRVYTTLSTTNDSYEIITPNLYLALIGEPASGKSFGKDRAADIFTEANPFLLLGASTQSPEHIVTLLSKDETAYAFLDQNNQQITTHSLTFFVNEIENWIKVNPLGMVSLFTDIYDRRFFDAGTIKHGLQPIPYPCINVLACGIPEWIQEQFKHNVLRGGFARRMLFIYYPKIRNRKADQSLHQHHVEARQRAISHLVEIQNLVGPFVWTKEARVFYDNWYVNFAITHPNTLMQQFLSSKNILLIKLAMAFALSEDSPKLILDRPHFEIALATLEAEEPNIVNLFSGAGRNENNAIRSRLVDVLRSNGGFMREKALARLMENDIDTLGFVQIVNHLIHTEQAIKFPAHPRDKPEAPNSVWLCLSDSIKRAQEKLLINQ